MKTRTWHRCREVGRPLVTRWAFAALACFGLAHAANAGQDLTAVSLDTLLDLEVSGASKFALRVSESPSSATVIGAEEIRALGYRTLADALQSVRGLVVSSDRTYSYLGVRGYAAAGDYNTRILLLIDGNRVNDTVFEQAFLGTDFPLDLNLVERIEFIPGQGSAVHGGNALFGVVNVVTKHPGEQQAGEVGLTVGSGDLRKLRVTGSQPIGANGRLLVSASQLRLAGRSAYYSAFDAPETAGGMSVRTDHERGDHLYLKYVHNEFVTTLLHGDRLKGLSAFPGTVFGDPGNQYRDTQTLADAALAHRIGAANLWKLRVYAGQYSFRGDYLFDYPPVTLNLDRAESRWWGIETQLLSQQFDDHKLVVGFDLQRSPHRDQSNADLAPVALTYLDEKRSSTRHSVFAEDQWAWSPSLSFTAGLRWDRIDSGPTATQFSPRLALVARPDPKLVVKLIHGTGFRPPNAYETYYGAEGGGGYKGNPDLRNERVQGTELVFDYRPSPDTRVTASAYANEATNLLIQSLDTNDNQLVFKNVGSLHARGLELEGERVWRSGVHLRANASFQRTRDTSDQGLDQRNASRLGKLALIVPMFDGWTLGNQTVLVSKRGDVAGYGVTHLTLSHRWAAQRAEIAVSAFDVLNRRPDDPGSDSVLQPISPRDGRTWLVTFKLAF